ncbi:hypothetical protein CC85DRAFT_103843 [Cutaneotrichosporon oleaginosum]|uniref:Uncharacterized protein n=1 Tax=Cutaneotrichosporon oleaginosum TaxID=879819 RepID=A0A0J0XL36_9TREE|nr:uncharacterized protein CC85DRAFT_103843 [Cutaneotrichosporon oleaginosum]KLT41826.1 hypothetical protein CC85DRAFT_103843 [Cutaneotrichosporon oleaginosum]TXT14747.1 hypothetical protein COLE_00940 [Cutaneotrichosporon oleaginosum]
MTQARCAGLIMELRVKCVAWPNLARGSLDGLLPAHLIQPCSRMHAASPNAHRFSYCAALKLLPKIPRRGTLLLDPQENGVHCGGVAVDARVWVSPMLRPRL